MQQHNIQRVAALVFALLFILAGCKPQKEAAPSNQPGSKTGEKTTYETIGYPEYPTDEFFITEERKNYKDATMVLRVPALDNLVVDVIGGVTNADLKRGVGLFDQAQLPGVSNQNVSIAGHRDIEGAEFYKIDKIGEGDLLYLLYDGKEYVYEYESTEIIESNDWGFVYCGEYSKISLMSCDPIGTTEKRIIVVGRLVQVNELGN